MDKQDDGVEEERVGGGSNREGGGSSRSSSSRRSNDGAGQSRGGVRDGSDAGDSNLNPCTGRVVRTLFFFLLYFPFLVDTDEYTAEELSVQYASIEGG